MRQGRTFRIAAFLGVALSLGLAGCELDIEEAETRESPSPTVTEPGPEPTTPEPEPETDADPLDADAILAMLQEFADQWNSRDYINGSAHFSSQVEQRCGGPTALAFALSQHHDVLESAFEFTAVEPWDDAPEMADITFTESAVGDSWEETLGYDFIFEDGSWRFDDLFPPGTDFFCD